MLDRRFETHWPLWDRPDVFPDLGQRIPRNLTPSEGGQRRAAEVAELLGIGFNAFGGFVKASYGPKMHWRKHQDQGDTFVILDKNWDDWIGRDWKKGEEELLKELQHTNPARHLIMAAQRSLERLGETQNRDDRISKFKYQQRYPDFTRSSAHIIANERPVTVPAATGLNRKSHLKLVRND